MRKIRPLMRLMWIFLCLVGTIGTVLIISNRIEIYYGGIVFLVYICAINFGAIDHAIGRDEKLEKMSKEEREREKLKLKKAEESYYRDGKIRAAVNMGLGIIFFIILIIIQIKEG